MLHLDFQSRQAGSLPAPRPKGAITLKRVLAGSLLLVTFSALSSLAFIERESSPAADTSQLMPVPTASALKKDANSNPFESRIHLDWPLPANTPLSILENEQPLDRSTANPWIEISVKKGDTLSSLLSNEGVSAQQIYRLVDSSALTKSLTRMRPGQKLRLLKTENGSLTQLQYIKSVEESLNVELHQDGHYNSHVVHSPLEARPVYKSGIINDSLFVTASRNQIPDEIIMQLVSLFGWDIDFALDIRKGDSFTVIFNDLYKDNERIRSGRILAAEFINQGKSIKAVRYTNSSGDADYFSPEGLSMRKAFLRSPVKFSRISSGFTKARWHPVLSKWRSHKGVDYAAPSGTPVRASGDGKVIHVGKKGGYGKTIILSHGGKYSTLYAHLSRYATNMRKGKKVKQGQLIGHVGKTGLATGPHLHYEFRVNGVHRNPLTVKLPAAEPVDPSLKPHFKTQTADLLQQLQVLNKTLLAANLP